MLVTPNLHFNGRCKEALQLYKKAFDGKITILLRYCDANDMSTENMTNEQKDYVYHAEMIIANQRFMFSDSIDEIINGQNISIVVTFESTEEVKKAYNVLSPESTIIHPLQETTYSSCFVSLVDKFGMRWELMTENNA